MRVYSYIGLIVFIQNKALLNFKNLLEAAGNASKF